MDDISTLSAIEQAQVERVTSLLVHVLNVPTEVVKQYLANILERVRKKEIPPECKPGFFLRLEQPFQPSQGAFKLVTHEWQLAALAGDIDYFKAHVKNLSTFRDALLLNPCQFAIWGKQNDLLAWLTDENSAAQRYVFIANDPGLYHWGSYCFAGWSGDSALIQAYDALPFIMTDARYDFLPLCYAAWGGCLTYVESTLKCYESINTIKKTQTAEGRNLWHYAAMGSSLPLMQYHLEKFTDREYQLDFHGRSPLHYAAFNRNQEMMAYLIEQGFDPYLLDNAEQTPLEMMGLPYDELSDKLKAAMDGAGYTEVIRTYIEEAKCFLEQSTSAQHRKMRQIRFLQEACQAHIAGIPRDKPAAAAMLEQHITSVAICGKKRRPNTVLSLLFEQIKPKPKRFAMFSCRSPAPSETGGAEHTSGVRPATAPTNGFT